MTRGMWVQLTGLALQVVGVVVLISGIRRTRAFLGEPKLRDGAAARLRRLWRKALGRREPVPSGVGEALALGLLLGEGRAKQVWSGVPLEERVQQLQELVDRHEDELGRLTGRIDRETRERKEADRREEAERQRLRAQLEERIKAAAGAGLTREFAGTLLVLVGLIVIGIGLVIST